MILKWRKNLKIMIMINLIKINLMKYYMMKINIMKMKIMNIMRKKRMCKIKRRNNFYNKSYKKLKAIFYQIIKKRSFYQNLKNLFKHNYQFNNHQQINKCLKLKKIRILLNNKKKLCKIIYLILYILCVHRMKLMIEKSIYKIL